MRNNDVTPSIVTVGTFDGLHKGHQLLLRTLRDLARENGLRPLAITFDRHPLETIAPERAPKCLASTEERCRLIKAEGVEPVTVEFTEALSRLTAGEWMDRMARDYGARMLVVGYDNTFGCDGMHMSPEEYTELGRQHGISVITAPVVDGISSSAVRKAVMEGRVNDAFRMTGRPYSITGPVIDGDKVGRTIGFPTANIFVDESTLLPSNGVYAGEILLEDGRKFTAVVNIGNRPTLGPERPLRVEAHLIGFSGDLYGTRVTLSFLRKLRDEMKFGSLDELRDAIEKDKRMAMEGDLGLKEI